MRFAFAIVTGLLLCSANRASAEPFAGMVALTVEGQRLEGTPVFWDQQDVYLLERDGWLRRFKTDDATDFSKSSDRFRPSSISELRNELLKDLDKEYAVSGTGHYLVVHRRGQRAKWARRFEDLYRSFVHYFAVRGFKPAEPPFPLMGIVCKDRSDFQRYAAEHGESVSGSTVGYYSQQSNRIILYDMGGDKDSESWQENASTIIHEATHQTAFNAGIHNRYAPPPLWVTEGLATMFEAPGVYDSRHYTSRADRVNREQLAALHKTVLPRHRPESLRALVASDKRFRAIPTAGYAQAWALSFYLIETQPQKYSQYLARIADREPFTESTAKQRTADFTAVFGDDWRMLQARFRRFFERLK